jgi:phosphatidylglycerophosphatase C
MMTAPSSKKAYRTSLPRMSLAPETAPALALFDFDGTITFCDTFSAFVFFATPTRRIVSGVVELAPMIVRFRLGLVKAKEMRRAMIAQAFTGRSEAEVRAQGKRFATDVLPKVMRPEVLERIAWHESRGHRVALVSASLGVYLDPLCRRMGWERISSDLEAKDGILTGRYEGEDCTGSVKASRVRERFSLAQFADIYAYGDTAEDRELLGLASRRFFRGKEL